MNILKGRLVSMRLFAMPIQHADSYFKCLCLIPSTSALYYYRQNATTREFYYER
jgi:hypothetical protein